LTIEATPESPDEIPASGNPIVISVVDFGFVASGPVQPVVNSAAKKRTPHQSRVAVRRL